MKSDTLYKGRFIIAIYDGAKYITSYDNAKEFCKKNNVKPSTLSMFIKRHINKTVFLIDMLDVQEDCFKDADEITRRFVCNPLTLPHAAYKLCEKYAGRSYVRKITEGRRYDK